MMRNIFLTWFGSGVTSDAPSSTLSPVAHRDSSTSPSFSALLGSMAARNSATSVWPLSFASERGVWMSALYVSSGLPISTRSCTMGRSPLAAAICSAMFSSSSTHVTSAPACSSASTAPLCPERVAKCSAFLRVPSRASNAASTSAPCCTSPASSPCSPRRDASHSWRFRWRRAGDGTGESVPNRRACVSAVSPLPPRSSQAPPRAPIAATEKASARRLLPRLCVPFQRNWGPGPAGPAGAHWPSRSNPPEHSAAHEPEPPADPDANRPCISARATATRSRSMESCR
mmetsp:Transcript_51438/g.122482  ORF Transcript_51438/g.122482 Transcript_51438/m.122482 type:complete len:287 (-) Transcript_51438:62-922(-)